MRAEAQRPPRAEVLSRDRWSGPWPAGIALRSCERRAGPLERRGAGKGRCDPIHNRNIGAGLRCAGLRMARPQAGAAGRLQGEGAYGPEPITIESEGAAVMETRCMTRTVKVLKYLHRTVPKTIPRSSLHALEKLPPDVLANLHLVSDWDAL